VCYTLYYININNLTEEEFLPLVPLYLQQEVTKYKHKEDRLRTLAGKLLLRHIFGKDYVIKTNQYHKPYIEGDLKFNISHSGDYTILALSKAEVGCDIEMHKKHDYQGVSKILLTTNELTYLNQHTNTEHDYLNTFYQFWTLKESYLKCTGKGFFLAPQDFSLNLNQNEIKIITSTEKDFLTPSLHLIDLKPNYTVASCINLPLHPAPKIIEFNLQKEI